MAQNNLLHQCQLLRKNQWRKGAAIGLFLMEQAWRIAEDGCGVGRHNQRCAAVNHYSAIML